MTPPTIHLSPYSFAKLAQGAPFSVNVSRRFLSALSDALGSGAPITVEHGATWCHAQVTALSNHGRGPLNITIVCTSKPKDRTVPYKIKGKGDRRTVHDVSGVLIGRLVRHERPVLHTTQRYVNGRPVSATIRKVTEVWWRAHDADGNRLGRVPRDLHGAPAGAWKGASRSTLKAWTEPSAWEGLTTSGERADVEMQNAGAEPPPGEVA